MRIRQYVPTSSSTTAIRLSDSLAPLDTLTVAAAPVQTALRDTIAASDTLSLHFATGIGRADSLTATDGFSPAASPAAAVSDTLAASDALAGITTAARALADALTPTDAINPSPTLHATISDIIAAADGFTSTAAPSVHALVDTLAVTDALQQAAGNYVFSLTDAPVLSDNLSPMVPFFTARWADTVAPFDGLSSAAAVGTRWIDDLFAGDHLGYAITIVGALGSRTRQPRTSINAAIGATFDVTVSGRMPSPHGAVSALFCMMNGVRVVSVSPDLRTVRVPKL